MRLLRCRWLVLVVLVLVGASCTDGGDFPDEGDVSEEAFLAMPGAVEIESVFTKGHRITDIDGRARDYSSILSIEYEIDGATGHDVYDWYLAELSDSSWEFRTTGTLERGGEPDQCRNSQGYCGSFQAIGTETPGESMIISLELYLSNGVDDAGSPLGIAHIDDEIDGYRIRSLVEFAPAE